MPVATLLSGERFNIDSGESLLDAALRAKITLPYSCKTGRCSTCKCQLISGETCTVKPEVGLSEKEKKAGWILSCARSATSDIEIDVENIGVDIPAAKTLPCRISALNFLAKDVMQVFIRLPPKINFNYLPGQYINIIGPNGVRRSYSLANAFFIDNLLELHIKKFDQGVMSEYWFEQAKVNDLLRLYGPLGTFFMREVAGEDLIFLATGTGMAPIKSMLECIEAMPESDAPKSINVFWGARTRSDIYIDVRKKMKNYNFFPVLSRAEPAWGGMRGYVQDALISKRFEFDRVKIYACGSEAMIRDAKKLAIEAGVDPRKFYSDAFVIS